MTEHEWLHSDTTPCAMLEFALRRQGRLNNRRRILMAMAAARLFQHHLTDHQVLDLLQVGERYHDGLCSVEEYDAAREVALETKNRAFEAMVARGDHWGEHPLAYAAVMSMCMCMIPLQYPIQGPIIWNVFYVLREGTNRAASRGEKRDHLKKLRKQQCDTIREIMGNPFRSFRTAPPWQGVGTIQPDGKFIRFNDTITTLAQIIHQDALFDRLPILADALEEAGVDDAYLLDHLRNATFHSRGCWALDVSCLRA